MKIIKLTAENVKRLRAVEITPDGTLQIVTGRNAQGKTSVLDSIWLALGGGAASRETVRPIRDGESTARVELDLGDLIVTRTWREGAGSTLTVTAPDGAKYPSPQSMLDSLVGRLSFDPLAFTRLSPRDQVTALLDLVELDVDLDALAEARQEAYEERAAVGRRGKALGELPVVDESLPEEETPATTILGALREAQAAEHHAETLRRDAAAAQARVDELTRQVQELSKALDVEQARAAALAKQVKALPAPVDMGALETELAGVEAKNAAIRANNNARARREHARELRAEYDALTEQITTLDQQKADALAAADFPVEGLGFDDTGVTLNGIPFTQASTAEQIRVSLAMAMALNPTLRVIRILDGSLLDPENMALIGSMAAENDFQVWIERVSDDTPTAVVIEDGQIS
jgi:hypothetical protein